MNRLSKFFGQRPPVVFKKATITVTPCPDCGVHVDVVEEFGPPEEAVERDEESEPVSEPEKPQPPQPPKEPDDKLALAVKLDRMSYIAWIWHEILPQNDEQKKMAAHAWAIFRADPRTKNPAVKALQREANKVWRHLIARN